MKNIGIIGFLISFFFMSCGEKELAPLEYMKWVQNPENGLLIKEQMKNYNFTLQYQPLTYTVINELQQENLEEEILKEAIATREGLQYFTFKMATTSNKAIFSGNKNLTDSTRHYLNYEIQKDFCLLETGDTLPCKLFHFENTNGMTPYDTFVLGFESSINVNNDKTFLFKANVLDLDWIAIKIEGMAINSIPKVKTI